MSGREFGAGVQAALKRTGLSNRKISEQLGWDPAKLSDLVNGKGGCSSEDLAVLLGFCQVPAAERQHLMELFTESRDKGWLQITDSGAAEQVRTLIEQERLATGIKVWALNLVPGLLQIPEYTRAVVQRSTVAPKDTEQLVAARVARRVIFHPTREFTFYIHEQALRLPVGGPDVMSAQLHDLLQMRVRPYVTIRIVPTSFGAHAGLAGSFIQLSYEKYEPVVFVESQNAGLFLEDKGTLAIYTEVLESLDRTAMDEEQSRRLITDILS
ncbi:hypothetical protein Lesp02_09560 [Lentzea sp. NBRC 105346]|nr:hypothetical protein Lesp02_09560 [Lentzea sp. NBRC 105346]